MNLLQIWLPVKVQNFSLFPASHFHSWTVDSVRWLSLICGKSHTELYRLWPVLFLFHITLMSESVEIWRCRSERPWWWSPREIWTSPLTGWMQWSCLSTQVMSIQEGSVTTPCQTMVYLLGHCRSCIPLLVSRPLRPISSWQHHVPRLSLGAFANSLAPWWSTKPQNWGLCVHLCCPCLWGEFLVWEFVSDVVNFDPDIFPCQYL